MPTVPPQEEPFSDDHLRMRRIAEGDQAALRDLIARWQGPVINFFYRSLNDRERSEDLAQILFVRLYRAAPRYQPHARFTTFLFHIARRLLINEHQHARRRPLDIVDPDSLTSLPWATPAATPEVDLEEIFARALEKLPENQRTAILLLKQQELSYQEIATVMDASESAVKTWIFRARQFLKQELRNAV